jgi:hypothetical protein
MPVLNHILKWELSCQFGTLDIETSREYRTFVGIKLRKRRLFKRRS